MKAIPGAFHWIFSEIARWFQEILESVKSCAGDNSVEYFVLDYGSYFKPWSTGCWSHLPVQPSTRPGDLSSLRSSENMSRICKPPEKDRRWEIWCQDMKLFLFFLHSWPSNETQISLLLFFCQPDQAYVLPTVQRSGSHQSQTLWQKYDIFGLFGFQTIQCNLQQRSPWPPDGLVCCREGPHHPSCQVRYCNPTNIN